MLILFGLKKCVKTENLKMLIEEVWSWLQENFTQSLLLFAAGILLCLQHLDLSRLYQVETMSVGVLLFNSILI